MNTLAIVSAICAGTIIIKNAIQKNQRGEDAGYILLFISVLLAAFLAVIDVLNINI